MRRSRNLIHVVVAAVVLGACKDESPPVPGSLTATAGDQQTAVVGAPLTAVPTVLLKDTRGRPMHGVVVTFAVTAGGSLLAGPAMVKTGPDGVASAGTWTLGIIAVPNAVTATVQGLAPLVFTATANAGAPANAEVAAGNGQTAVVGSGVPVTPEVTIKDSHGNLVPNVAVTFTSATAGAIVTGATATTDGSGRARVGGWLLSTTAGANTLIASTSNGIGATFTALGTAGPATQMNPLAGDGQSSEAAGSVGVRPSVVVRDQYNNPIAGVTVVFSISAGAGSITGAVQMTNASGVATVGSWQLGSTPGPNILTAQAAGVSPVNFTATATAPLIFTMSIVDGNAQSAPTGWTVAVPPSVVVRDQLGQPAAGRSVVFTAVTGAGTVVNGVANTNASGIAQIGWWRMGPAAGGNTLRATSAGTNDVTFTANAIAAPPSSGYHISIAYLTTPTARQHQAVINAVTRWQQVITADLSDFTNLTFPATSCSPAFNDDAIDDILVQVDFSFIDGPGGILGQAGPCLLRNSNALTAVGRLRLDAADLADMETKGTIDDVILHEIGHILGIGSLWTQPTKNLLRFAATDSSTFVGALAGAAFLASGGSGFAGAPVPAENCKTATGIPINNCGSGTRDVHWREAVLGRELMTGYISPAGISNPLSAVTIQSLADIGYTVDMGVADSFTIGAKPIAGPQQAPIPLNETKPNWTIQKIDDR